MGFSAETGEISCRNHYLLAAALESAAWERKKDGDSLQQECLLRIGEISCRNHYLLAAALESAAWGNKKEDGSLEQECLLRMGFWYKG
ncbi:hypothetical protein CDAR_513381 [Caerostris darwini]|uniref:Uncharacterized protein n=1 Tax=Caerostris darwini TaxID=1538125 RepID=A0AAV4WWZ1_9ARAC|nr:hypothetical protein CDAR_513381 [Caerostris darwini]